MALPKDGVHNEISPHGGLATCDEGRLALVMIILEEAAQCLQILILTCNPERYSGLEGAKFIDLE